MSQAKSGNFVSTSIGWYNICVSSKAESSFFGLKPGKEAVQIIKNVSGEVSAGSTLAIMGSSGAGKTTLLNVLTARNLSNFQVEGAVKINGQLADVNMITAISAYVQQQDLFIATLTVREHLIFQALVRMDDATSDEAKVERVNEVMKELSLEKCGDTMVGGTFETGKGISGGEMKRLAFAVEILTNPSLILCDEPTSGLDSFMAAGLVSYLNKMAAVGRTIICTIHQPSSEVFNLFQNLLLMADGRVAYLGPTQDALGYFSQLNIGCPPNYNPADYYIRELAMIPGKEHFCKKKINVICDYYNSKHQVNVDQKHRQSTFVAEKQVRGSLYKTSCYVQYQALAWRSYLVTLREPLLTYVRLIQALATALILGMFFIHQNYDQRGMFNTNGALYLFIINLSLNNAFCVVNVFCSELPIFLREHNSGIYRAHAYFITKNLAESPIFVLIPIFFALIIYYMVGFYPTFDAFLFTILVGIIISAVGVSYGYLISCLCNNTDLALSAGPPIMIPLQLLGGYYINSKTIPSSLAWAQFLSWFYYGFNLLINNQWKHVDYLDCDGKNNTSHWLNNTATPQPIFTTGKPKLADRFSSMCFKNGQQVIEFLDLGQKNQYADFAALIILLLLLRAFAFLALFLRAKYSR